MKQNILLFVGLILLGVGAIVYFSISADTVVEVNGKPVQDSSLNNILKWSIGGGLGLLGLLFLIGGIRGKIRNAKLNKQKLHILKTGIETEGKVTFVDKNYSFLINNNPVFSIVEYTYKDKSGTTHSRRINNINSEIVIRNQINVGSIVAIKYDRVDSSQSIILLHEAAKQPNQIVKCKYCGSRFNIIKHESCPKCGAG